jgi:hypothetical protein
VKLLGAKAQCTSSQSALGEAEERAFHEKGWRKEAWAGQCDGNTWHSAAARDAPPEIGSYATVSDRTNDEEVTRRS